MDTAAGIIFTLAAIAFIINLLVGRTGFDFGYIGTKYPLFLEATKVTIYATTISFVIGSGIGFLVGWARTARSVPLARILRDHEKLSVEEESSPWKSKLELYAAVLWSGLKHYLRRIADGYVEIMRGTPLFVQIILAWSVMLVYYPQLDLNTIALIAGIAAMTANTGGYQSEIFRAGLQTVQSGQVEAARAIGLSRWGAMRRVVLPQALRLVIPPLTNEYIGLLKASSLLFVIGIRELTFVGKNEAFISARVFEVFALVTGIYFLITVPVSKVIEYVERKYRIPGLGIQKTREFRVGRSFG